jgi:DNA sulfur modification protein DndD
VESCGAGDGAGQQYISSTFPIVMDSPFGSLDEIYRWQVANLLPPLADQVIVMAT